MPGFRSAALTPVTRGAAALRYSGSVQCPQPAWPAWAGGSPPGMCV